MMSTLGHPQIRIAPLVFLTVTNNKDYVLICTNSLTSKSELARSTGEIEGRAGYETLAQQDSSPNLSLK